MKFVVIGCLCAGALAAVGCADGRGVPTSPSATAAVSGGGDDVRHEVCPRLALSASPRSGDLHVTKECSGYTGGAAPSARSRPRTSTQSRLARGSSISSRMALNPWAATSSSTCRGPATTPRSAIAHSPSECARSRAGPGSSPISRRRRRSLCLWVAREGPTSAGPARTASVRRIEPRSTSRPRLHRWTDRGCVPVRSKFVELPTPK